MTAAATIDGWIEIRDKDTMQAANRERVHHFNFIAPFLIDVTLARANGGRMTGV